MSEALKRSFKRHWPLFLMAASIGLLGGVAIGTVAREVFR